MDQGTVNVAMTVNMNVSKANCEENDCEMDLEVGSEVLVPALLSPRLSLSAKANLSPG